jgi:hypothetical protein
MFEFPRTEKNSSTTLGTIRVLFGCAGVALAERMSTAF